MRCFAKLMRMFVEAAADFTNENILGAELHHTHVLECAADQKCKSATAIIPCGKQCILPPQRIVRSAWLAQEAEASRLIKTSDRMISERPPRGGLSVFT